MEISSGKLAILMMVVLLAAWWMAPRPAAGAGDLSQVRTELERLLHRDISSLGFDLDGNRIDLHEGVAEFYRQRHFYPAWLVGRELNDQAGSLLATLLQASTEGLDPKAYQASDLKLFGDLNRTLPSYGEIWDRRCLARLDIMLTNAFLRYAGNLARGRVDPAAVYPHEWRVMPAQVDVVGILREGLRQGMVAESLAELAPRSPYYVRLRNRLGLYRQIAAAGGWPQLPAGESVYPGMMDWRVPWLRRHLAQVGDLPDGGDFVSLVFDSETVAALQRFQSRHNLKTDGVLGPATLAAINVPVEERIRQIELNMERSRWLPENLGERHLIVNIADFRLTVMENGESVLDMKVVVGSPERRTPVFSSRLSYLIFSPYWNVPATILQEDKLPRIKADIEYLGSHHYQILAWKGFPNRVLNPAAIDWEPITAENFPGLLRQKPGPWNALGQVKFMLPNSFNVYLHDTPERSLFDRQERIFSSGCIRLERPADLAGYLLQERRDWDQKRIMQAMKSGEPERVDVPIRLPVHVLYQTVWVDEQGLLQFRRDVYQRDRDLYAALNGVYLSAGTLLAAEGGSAKPVMSN